MQTKAWLRLCVVAGLLVPLALALTGSARATPAPAASTGGAVAPAPDFDVRGAWLNALPSPPGAVTTVSDARTLVHAIGARVLDLRVRWSSLTGAVSRIGSVTQPLTAASTDAPLAVAQGYLAGNLGLFNLSADDVSETRVSRNFTTRANGVSHITLQQMVNGVDVFGGVVKFNIDATGRILNVSGEPIPAAHAGINTDTPILAPEDALGLAAGAAGVTSYRDLPGGAQPVYFPLGPGSLLLAWDLNVEDTASDNIYRTLVDATDGTILWRQNTTMYDDIPAHGPVYPSDSPNPNSPEGTSTGIVPRTDVPFKGIGYFPHDDPHYDWWAGAARTTTVSNNVFAQEDRDGNDSGGFQPTAGAGEDFTFPIDLTQDPKTYEAAAIVNLFYWNNHLHDLYYGLGFDEVSGNFQKNNFGLGGSDNDPVRADAQDNRDGVPPSLCNANFSFPSGQPKMQMYTCNAVSPERDGDLESIVMAHEYTHGVHGRLVPTSGFQVENEGWADFMALSFLAESKDDVQANYGVGDWLDGGPIRRQLYSTDQTVFTRTYANITDGATCATATCSNNHSTTCTKDSDCGGGGATCQALACTYNYQCVPPATAINQGLCSPEVHNTGELWAETLWIARANLVIKYGFSTGGLTMEQDVVDGMKMSPDNPDFLDARDGILSADLADNGGVNQCLIWNAFARMGMGLSAVSGGVNDINPVQAFDTPSTCTPNIAVTGATSLGNVCPGNSLHTTISINNTGSGDLIVGKVSVLSGSSDVSIDATSAFPAAISADAHLDFTVTCAPESSGLVSATLRIQSTDADHPNFDVSVSCNAPAPGIATSIPDTGAFGDVCIGSFADEPLSISNTGGCPLTVSGIASTSTQFLVAGSPFPFTVAPGTATVVPIRFQSAAPFGPKSANLTISDDASIKVVGVTGNTPPGDIRVTGSTTFGTVCAGSGAEKPVSVCNVGKCDLGVTSVAFDPACADFTLVNNPFPATVSHDSCQQVTIRFTPTSSGPKSCTLVVHSDDPDTPVISLPVTADTPAAAIDVPGDQSFAPTVLQSVGACTTADPFPVSNLGVCPLTITAFGISNDAAEYSLAGLPSFPIILAPGHIAGDGDLTLDFAPQVLDRARLGTVHVTYVQDPVTGATADVSSALCGEGVRTGARVLVKAGGVPLASVESIKLQRINANRNKSLLDTIDTARNLALQTVTPAGPCGPFQFHREYGTVGNPIQLLPGSYQVTVTAVVGGKRVKKSVGFDTNTCGFNPTIVVNF